MAYKGYINPEVAKMYGIPYSQLTAEQKRILHEDSLRRAKLIAEKEQAVLRNGLKAFEDEAKMERVLASIYKDCQKSILADVQETIAKVQKAGGTWSYANQSALTRSRGLFEQITQELSKLGVKESAVFYEGLGHIYTDQYLRQMYTLGQFTEVKCNLNRLNPALVRKTLDYPWSGAMFSDRLWNDKERLGKNLRVGLTQSMILGEGIPEITDRINKGIDTARYNAERIARTETKRVTYVSHDAVYQDTGVEELEYRCANGGDSRTCALCRVDNGKHYKRGEEPTLPRHPNCRCIYIPVVEDTFKPNELNELTGSIRGSESYDKWVQENADKLNPDGTLKEGWVRDWKNGGKLVHKGDPKDPQAPKKADPQKTEGKSDKVIQLESEKRDIQMQIDTKNEEYKAVPSKYQAERDKIETEKAELEAKLPKKREEIDTLTTQKTENTQQRRALRAEHREERISDDEYDKRADALIEESQRITVALNKAEEEYYDLMGKISGYRDEISKISAKVAADQRKIKYEIDSLTSKIDRIDAELLLRAKYPNHTDAFIDVMQSLEANKVSSKLVKLLPSELSEDKIIERLAGGDLTKGSCSSLAFSFIGNKHGLDVLDFRDGASRSCFSRNGIIQTMGKLSGVDMRIIKVKKEVADTAKILTTLDKGKEYYLAVGKHAAIVRNTEHGLEYLELQSGSARYSNGWKPFDTYGSIADTLYKRFGCRKTVDKMNVGGKSVVFEKDVVLMDVDSFADNDEFREILSYINTDPDKQRKGANGSVK